MDYLFKKWNEIKEKMKDKYLFIFLDFDGTLIPIAATPEKAVLPGSTKKLLEKISKSQRLKMAFISGRALDDIEQKIGLRDVTYSGNHGLEIEGPGIKFRPLVPPGYRKILERIKKSIDKKITSISGAFMEDKGLSLSLHYRLANKKQIPLVKTIFHETVIVPLVRDKIAIRSGKMVLEVRPPVAWDKGRVVLWLLARQRFAVKGSEVLPVYIGDDVSDEDAFKALENKGLTVFVGAPKASSAKYYLKDSGEVVKFLRRLSEIS